MYCSLTVKIWNRIAVSSVAQESYAVSSDLIFDELMYISLLRVYLHSSFDQKFLDTVAMRHPQNRHDNLGVAVVVRRGHTCVHGFGSI